jgi:hypothetical protein
MKTSAFTAKILTGLKQRVRDKKASLKDIARIAAKAVELAHAHPVDIPDDAVRRFFVQHPDAPGASGSIRAAEDAETQHALTRVRTRMGGARNGADHV